jgi:hypothetical protein
MMLRLLMLSALASMALLPAASAGPAICTLPACGSPVNVKTGDLSNPGPTPVFCPVDPCVTASAGAGTGGVTVSVECHAYPCDPGATTLHVGPDGVDLSDHWCSYHYGPDTDPSHLFQPCYG